MADRVETMWCTNCGARFTQEEVLSASACPKCNNEGVPCSTAEDLLVQINWHELRILGIWAENYARQCDARDSSNLTLVVASITGRLEQQFPDKTPLMLSKELAELPAKLQESGIEVGSVESSVPRPKPVLVNGPGAVGHTPRALP